MIIVFVNFSSSEDEPQSPSQPGRSIGSDDFSGPEAWVDDHGDYLFRIALLRVQDRRLAEDMVQETFLAALKARDSFEGRSSERTWMVSILKRKIIDHYRKNSRFAPLDSDAAPPPDFNEYGDRQGRWKEGFAPVDWGENPLQSLEQNQFRESLQKCISRLRENMAAVFTLREIDGKSTEEICKELEISASNVWVLLHRARTDLRRCLEMNWFESDKQKE